MIQPNVVILHADCTNRDHEAAQAFAACGAEADAVHFNPLRAREKRWSDYPFFALPGEFPGTHAIDRAYTAFRTGEIDRTGVLVHLVPDEGVDDRPVLAQELVPLHADDGLESIKDRIHAAEHRLLVTTLKALTQASS